MTAFAYTGVYQEYVVPEDTFFLDIELVGARGGNNYAAGAGGEGGTVTGKIAVIPGETLRVYVGGHGADSDDSNITWPGGWNGGGNGFDRSGGGGGATDIRRAPYGLEDRIAVAGGGGGAGWGSTTNHGNAPNGGDYGNAKGGTQTAGGTASGGGQPGALGVGGNGNQSALGGGGGGGGYYGGGGGGSKTGSGSYGHGGGGGSHYVDNVFLFEYTNGGNTGDGSATLEPLVANPVPAVSGADYTWEDSDYRYHVFTSSADLECTVGGLVEIFVIAAGGGSYYSSSSSFYTGGGGAGGVIPPSPMILTPGTYPVVVGVGVANGNGGDTTFNGVTAVGGGRSTSSSGATGGSGGGGSTVGSTTSGGGNTLGQGNRGGSSAGSAGYASRRSAGGGGGAGGPGENGVYQGPGGDGGPGIMTTWIDGTEQWVAGGVKGEDGALNGIGYDNYGGGVPGNSNSPGQTGIFVLRHKLRYGRVEVAPVQVSGELKPVIRQFVKPQWDIVWVHGINGERQAALD